MTKHAPRTSRRSAQRIFAAQLGIHNARGQDGAQGMDRREPAAMLNGVGNFSMDGFAGRRTLQKAACLLQAFGVNLGCRLAQYRHGAFCKAVAKYGHAARQAIASLPDTDVCFEGGLIQRRYEEFKELVAGKKNDLARLEIGASTYYLAAAGVRRDDAPKLTEGKKEGPSRSQCASMWSEPKKVQGGWQ